MKRQLLTGFFVIIIYCWSFTSMASGVNYEFYTTVPPGKLSKTSSVASFQTFDSGFVVQREGFGLRRLRTTENYCVDFAHATPCQPKSTSYSIDIYITNFLPTCEISARSNGIYNKAESWGVLDYAFYLRARSKYPNAPTAVHVKADFDYNLQVSYDGYLHPGGTSYDATSQLYVYSIADTGGVAPLTPDKIASIHCFDRPGSLVDKKQGILTKYIPPLLIMNVRLVSYCRYWQWGVVNEYEHFATQPVCKALADPVITIDPNQTVYIDGQEYPAKEVYEVVLSSDMLVPPEPPEPETSPFLPHILPLLLDE